MIKLKLVNSGSELQVYVDPDGDAMIWASGSLGEVCIQLSELERKQVAEELVQSRPSGTGDSPTDRHHVPIRDRRGPLQDLFLEKIKASIRRDRDRLCSIEARVLELENDLDALGFQFYSPFLMSSLLRGKRPL